MRVPCATRREIKGPIEEYEERMVETREDDDWRGASEGRDVGDRL